MEGATWILIALGVLAAIGAVLLLMQPK